MKKYSLALLMLLGALAFSFAGCTDNGKPSGGTGGTGGEETAPVSEAEWDAAFSRDAFKNVTADIKQSSGAESYSVQYKVDFGGDADLILVRSVSGKNTGSSLYAKKDGAEHSFALIDGKWSETDGQGMTANGVFEAFYANLLPFAEQYENAEYDSEAKLYDIAFTLEGYTVTAKAGFASANLVSLSYSAEQDGMTSSAEIVLSDYEKTELTFPETDSDTPGGTEGGDPGENPGGTEGSDPGENPGGTEGGDPSDEPGVTPTKMSKDAWEEMFSPTSISYSLYLKSPSEESNLDYLYFKEGDSWYFRSENADAQYDRFYEYSKDGAWLYEQQEGGIWFRTPTKQYPSDIEYLFTFLKDDYDLFELGKDGVYAALLPAGALPGAYEGFAAEVAVETDGQELHTVTITITAQGEEYMHRYSFTGEAQYTLPAADKIVDLITRTDWETALSANLFDNVTYTMTQGGGDDLFTVEMMRESKDGVLRIRHVNDPNNNPFLTFYEIESDDAFSYTKSGENWVKNIATFTVGSVNDDAAMFFTLLLQDEYYAFSYDAESGAYTAENFSLTVFDNTTIETEEIAVRFDGDKNPVSIRVRANEYTLEIAFSNVGSTSISDFPTQFIDGTIPDKMSEEEWEKTFDISSYTGADGKPNYTFESELINDDPAYSAFKMLVKYQSTENGSLVFCRDFDNAAQPEGTDQYSEEIDGKFYAYKLQDGKWIKTNAVSHFGGGVLEEMALIFAPYYDDFALSADGSYTAASVSIDMGGMYVDYINNRIVFDEGRISAIETTISMQAEGMKMEIPCRYTIYDVGSTVVTLPEADVDETLPDKMSEEEWEKAFDISSYTGADGKPNYTFESELINDDPAYSAFKMLVKYQSTENGSLVFCRDFDNAAQPEGTDQYSEEIDGKFYAYKLQDEKWIKTNAVSHFGGGVLEEMALIFAPYYDDFALSADGSYTAASVSIDMGGMYVDYINNRIVFDEGRISAIETTISMQAEGIKMEIPCRYTIYDVGSTVVTLPEADVDETLPDKMSEEEWEKAFDAELFKNLSYTLTTVSIEQDGSKSVQENTVQIIDEKDRMIARSSTVLDGDQNNDYYFVYLPADSGYTVYSYEKVFASAAGWSEYDKEGGEDPYYKTIAMFETFLKGSYDLLERSDDVTFTAAPEESNILSMTLTFEESKITSFTLTMQEMSVSVQLTYGVSDKIELPEGAPQAEKA